MALWAAPFLLQRDRGTTVALQIPASPMSSTLPPAPHRPHSAAHGCAPRGRGHQYFQQGRHSRAPSPVRPGRAHRSKFLRNRRPFRMQWKRPRVEVQAPARPASRPTIKLGKIAPPGRRRRLAEFERASSGFAGCERLAKSAERDRLSTLLATHSRCARAGSRGADQRRTASAAQTGLFQSPPCYPRVARTQRHTGRRRHGRTVFDATRKVTAIKLINGPSAAAARLPWILCGFGDTNQRSEWRAPFPFTSRSGVAFRLQ